MNFIINIFFATILPFSFVNQVEEQYCNTRFNFCVEYPEEYFDISEVSDNDDGITLRSSTQDLEMIISGSYNVMDWDGEDIYMMKMKDLKYQYKNIEEIGSNSTDSYFSFEVKAGGKRIFLKTYDFNDILVTLELHAGNNIPAGLLGALEEEIIITQNASR